MDNVFEFVVEEESAGLRLDRFLATKPEILSRSRAARLVEAGCVSISGKTPKCSYQVSPGERVVCRIPPPEDSELQPLELPLDIVFEDSDLLVVNKPPGLVVHPAAGHQQDTLVNALLSHTDDLSAGFDEKRPGIVHRLDKDTSGLLVVAKTEKAQVDLARQFKDKSATRVYQALVYGRPARQIFTIESFLGRHPSERKRFASVKQGGKKAITHVQVLGSSASSDLSLLELKLETGRTHQIRVHLLEQGHPIVGDPIYCRSGRLKSLKSVETRRQIEDHSRLMLHARKLSFAHPKDGQQVEFTVDWPSGDLELLSKLGLRSLDHE